MKKVSFLIGLLGVALLGLPQSASANHHDVTIKEVYPGNTFTPGSEDAEYVEIQAYSAGQNILMDQLYVNYYDADGGPVTRTHTFGANPPNGGNQRTFIAATAQAQTDLVFTADESLTDLDALPAAGGAVCLSSIVFGSIDCASYGAFTGTTPDPDGNSQTIADTQSMTRTIARGCATLLDAPDDTDDTDADFASTALSPQPNSVTPADTACEIGGGTTGNTPPVLTAPTGQRAAALKKCAKVKSKKKKKKCKRKARQLPI